MNAIDNESRHECAQDAIAHRISQQQQLANVELPTVDNRRDRKSTPLLTVDSNYSKSL